MKTNVLNMIFVACMVWFFPALPIVAQGSNTFTARHRLFSDSLRHTHPLPIYDFLEQALAEKDMIKPGREDLLKKVVFVKGSWDTLWQVQSDDACSISEIDGHHYMVSWIRGGQDLVNLVFPIDYELLAGSTRRIMEHDFVDGLSSFQPDTLRALPIIPFDALRPITGDSIYILEGDINQKMPNFTSHTFYTLKTITEQDASNKGFASTIGNRQPELLCDPQRPGETLANWLLSSSPLKPNVQLPLNFSMTDHTQPLLKVSLMQFMQYCRQQGCTPYFLFKGSTIEQGVSALLLLNNAASGYGHLVSLSCPNSQLTAKRPELSGRVSLFLPFAQLSGLSVTSPKGKSNTKRYE